MSDLPDTPFATDVPATSPPPVLRTGQEVFWATGRRKTAVARVRLRLGSGIILVNNRPYEEYFTSAHNQEEVVLPFLATDTAGRYDVLATVRGGGMTGQAGALKLGISRALMKADPATEERLRAGGFATRDARQRERDKYGQRGARARYQYSKR
jgi:small subunit ribosomal protein S9